MPFFLSGALWWSLGVIGRSVVLYSVLSVLFLGSIVACVLHGLIILKSALYDGYLTILYRSAVYSVWLLLYI